MIGTPAKTPWPVLLFGVSLGLAATWFFLGRLGHFSDDYFYNQRDVVTGEIRALLLDRPIHVWRPLFRLVVPALQTLFWNHDWVIHSISVLCHFLVCWLLLRVLVWLGVTIRSAAAAVLVFMVYPAHFEAVFWACCIPTLLGTALLLAMVHWQMWWMARPVDGSKGMNAVLPFAFGALAFVIASLNEQPAGPLVCLPLLALLRARPEGVPRAVYVRRAVVPPLLCGVALVGYLVGHFRHVKTGVRVQDGATPGARLLYRAGALVHDVPGEFTLGQFARGAFIHGAGVVAEHWISAAVFGGLLLIGAMVFVRWWMGSSNQEEKRDQIGRAPKHVGSIVLIAFGVAWYVAGWIPIGVVHHATPPRLHYVPDIGLVFVLAGLMGVLGRVRFRFEHVRRGALVCALGLLGLVWLSCTLMMIGAQDGYRLRHDRDVQEAADLARVAAAWVEPGTVFVPVGMDSWAVRTGSARFDGYFAPCWALRYAAGWNLQQVFKRTDVHVLVAQGTAELSVPATPNDGTSRGDERRVQVSEWLAKPFPPQAIAGPGANDGSTLEWSHAVPFRVNADGRVEVYTRVDVVDDRSRVVRVVGTFVPEQVRRILEHAPEPELILNVWAAGAGAHETGRGAHDDPSTEPIEGE